MTTGYTIKKLKTLKAAVLADGKIDWNETSELLEATRELAVRHGFPFEDFERQLVKCREDGVITPVESDNLAKQLDYLCTFFTALRLRFRILVIAMLALAVSAALVAANIVRANRLPVAFPVEEPDPGYTDAAP